MKRALGLLVVVSSCGGDDAMGIDAPPGASDGGATVDADPGAPDGGGNPASGRWVMGYYPGYQRDLMPADEIPWQSMTHLAIGRVAPEPDGSVDTSFDLGPGDGPAMARDLAMRARTNGVRSILMIGGAGEHEGFVGAASDANRAAFVANLVALREDYGVDGFDLDWEPVDLADQAPLLALAEDLRAAAPDAILTVPVGWVNANFPEVDPFWADLAEVVDQINIMTYGMAGPWDGWSSWHSSALMGHGSSTPSSVAASAQAYLDAGVPAAKLGVGSGFYGSCWSGVDAPGQSTAGAALLADDNVMSYAAIMSSYHQASAYSYDAAAAAPYLSFGAPTGPQSCTFVSYEDETSVAAKGAWVRTQGLGGVIVWTINEGHVAGADPLLDALHAGVAP